MKIPYKSLVLLILASFACNPVYSALRSKQRHRITVSQQNSAAAVNKPVKAKKLGKKERKKFARARAKGIQTATISPLKFFSVLSGGLIGYLVVSLVVSLALLVITGVHCTALVLNPVLSLLILAPCFAGAYGGAKLGCGAYDAVCSYQQSV